MLEASGFHRSCARTPTLLARALILSLILSLFSLPTAAPAQDPLPAPPLPPPAPPASEPSAGEASEEPSPEELPGFADDVRVGLRALRLRVLDSHGRVVPDLGPEDFVVRFEGREVPVEAVEWYEWGVPAGEAEREDGGELVGGPAAGADRELSVEGVGRRAAAETEEEVPGEGEASRGGGVAEGETEVGWDPLEPPTPAPSARLFVLFVQADLHPLRSKGHLRALSLLDDLLATLPPRDRVAVVSFDSHLELWRDFERGVEGVREAYYDAMRYGDPPRVAPGPAPSLAAHLDARAARLAATTEEGLELLAEALAEIPGTKTLLFFGWGLGERHAPDNLAVRRVARALQAAETEMVVVDVIRAASHELAAGLRLMATWTGGTYEALYGGGLRALTAMRRIGRFLRGYYVVFVDAEAVAGDPGGLEVSTRRRGLRVVRRGGRG